DLSHELGGRLRGSRDRRLRRRPHLVQQRDLRNDAARQAPARIELPHRGRTASVCPRRQRAHLHLGQRLERKGATIMNKRSKILFSSLAIFGLAGMRAAPARASTDNYLEAQVDTNVLSSILRQRFSTASDFCPTPIACPWNPQAECVIDHVVLGPPGTWT